MLHQSLTTYCPATTNAIVSGGASFDGSPHAFQTMSKVAIYSDGLYIRTLSVKYTNESSSVEYGGKQKPNNEFELTPGDHITEVILWKDSEGVSGIQMNTSTGKMSKHFGSDTGSPTIMRSVGGCLAGFSGVIQADKIHGLQTIWRHDVQGLGLGGDREFSQYYGGMGGTSFSDWPFVRHSDSAHIKTIRVRSETYIDGIQITYEDTCSSTSQQADYHGGSGGKEHFFRLEANEHIVAVLGRYNGYIVQLCFETNRGRTSDIFGGYEGESFRCQAPETSDGKATRLHYLCGRSGAWLNGILLVWAPF
ncbi:jacalin-like lectin domain protein [Rhizoctonia solani AG-3 Rhs1AP]|uniref:Jacalin-like lectin domain protein n=2 Tax=Rhizoctonia solani AG-3 TaxID=1086053 RepID=A0A074RYD4_9AGAM|nr:jacalin-like lectin domain protein [Rhizoctonia solani AG-3 Rhs1AP]KEP50290.1 jacalin-like lectin domain protein [Rhizoctonia solani 123E]